MMVETTLDPVKETGIDVPEPPHHFYEAIKSAESADLINEKAKIVHDMRCWQMKELGYRELESMEEVFKELKGESYSEIIDEACGRDSCPWVYNHMNDTYPTGWGQNFDRYIKYTNPIFWFLPPFDKKIKWSARCGYITSVEGVKIPTEVMDHITSLKKNKLVNSFLMVADEKVFTDPENIGDSPEILYIAVVESFEPTIENGQIKYRSSGPDYSYFLLGSS
jgi:hypothetical protein